MYYREYRTLFHIGETYGLHESNVGKNIRRIENILKKCKRFSLLGKEKLSGTNHQYEVILVDATESPIERPKKTTLTLLGEKEKAHNKNTICCRQKNKENHMYSSGKRQNTRF